MADISNYLSQLVIQFTINFMSEPLSLLSNEANQMVIHLYLADETVGHFIPSSSDCSLLSQPSRVSIHIC